MLTEKSMKLIKLAFLAFLLTLIFNPGWIAMDEYNHGMLLYLPAQNVDIAHVKELSILRSPMQVMPMYGLGKIAYHVFGIETNWGQYRFIQFGIGIFNFFILLLGLSLFYKNENREKLKLGCLALIAFHFVSSFAFTRPMFESLATPLFFVALGFFQNFSFSKRSKELFFFFVFLGLACIFRPHVGLFIILPAYWILENKEWKYLIHCFLFGLISAAIVGLPDCFFYHQPFHMFREYMSHNLEENKFFTNKSKYGASGWWVYIPTFIGISFLAFFLGLKNFPYKQTFFKYRYYWTGIILFILVHSAIPHKEERFLIPLLPVCFVCMSPFFVHLYENRKKYKFRWISLISINFLLWFFVVSTPAQNNAISFARYLRDKNNIHLIQYPAEAKLMMYTLFFERDDVAVEKVPFDSLINLNKENCQDHYLFRYDLYEKIKKNPTYEFVEKFDPGLLEYLIVLGNPSHNARRGPLYLMKCR